MITRLKTKPDKSYGASLIKRHRRTKAEINKLCDDLFTIAAKFKPATIRQIFYQAVSAGIIPKTERAYDDVCRLLGVMRRDGRLPFSWLIDNTRWMRKPDTYSDLEAYLDVTVSTYRKALWIHQDAYVEVWSEKDAISGVIADVTDKWDVPLMISRGFASLSFLHAAAAKIKSVRKPTFLYYLGDRDPSGVQIDRSIEASLREFAPKADITFKRIAVTPQQIEEFSLPTRPTKQTDSRAKTFDGESVEVDAIPPNTLRELVELMIAQHIDVDTYKMTLDIERAERDTLQQVVDSLGGDA